MKAYKRACKIKPKLPGERAIFESGKKLWILTRKSEAISSRENNEKYVDKVKRERYFRSREITLTTR